MDIILFAAFLAIGIFIGRKQLLPARLSKSTGNVLTAVVYLLLFTVGLEVGQYREILSNLGKLGLQSLLLCTASMLGSAVFCMLYRGR